MLLALRGDACQAVEKYPVPATHEIEVLLPGTDAQGRPSVFVGSNSGNGNMEIEIPPTVLVHRYYYTGDRTFQGPYLPGGPSIVVAQHPKTQQRVYVDVQLLPGAPQVIYRDSSIEYRYGKKRVVLSFTHAGGAKVNYKHHLPLGTSIAKVAAGTAKTTAAFAKKTRVPQLASSVARTTVGFVKDAGGFVAGKVGQLVQNTPLAGLAKSNAELDRSERDRKLRRIAEQRISEEDLTLPTIR